MEKPEINKACNNCEYYEAYGNGYGECRRNPPQVYGTVEDSGSEWPVIRNENWCGDHTYTQESKLEWRDKYIKWSEEQKKKK